VETKIADTDVSGFEINPTSEQLTVDPYDVKTIRDSNETLPRVSNKADTVGNKLPAEKVENIKSDPAVQAAVQASGKDFNGYVNDVSRKLPSGVDMADVLREVDIVTVDQQSERLQERMSEKDWLQGADDGFFKSALKYTQEFKPFLDIKGIGDQIDGYEKLNEQLPDYISESSLTLAAIDRAIALSGNIDANKYIQAAGLPKLYNDRVVELSLDLAAKRGRWLVVRDIINEHDDVFIDTTKRYRLVKSILINYKMSKSDIYLNIWETARLYDETLTEIYPQWKTTERNNFTIVDQRMFQFAGEDSLRLLSYCVADLNVQTAAVIQRDAGYTIEPYETFRERHYKSILR